MRETWAGRLPAELRPENDEQREQRIGWAADHYYELLVGQARTDEIDAGSVMGFVSQVALRRHGLEIGELLEARVRAYLRLADLDPGHRVEAQVVADCVRTGGLTLYWGPAWDDPRLISGGVQVPLPVDHTCFLCSDPVVAGERGLIVPVHRERTVTSEPVHLECEVRQKMGHALDVCSCTGYGFDRRAREAVMAAINQTRAERGYGPL